MPQLDKVTFLSQFFWLCFFYLGFYYIVLKYFLPKISRILTLRKKKMNLSQYGSNSLDQENQQVRQKLDTILSKGLSLSRNVFTDFLSRTTNWLDESLTGVNKTHYKTVNNSYIQSLGETSLSQNILLYHASTHLPDALKVNVLLGKMKNLKKTSIIHKIQPQLKNEALGKNDEAVLEKKNSKKNKKK